MNFLKAALPTCMSGAGPPHRFLGPIRMVRMCSRSRNLWGGTQIQTHCGEETNVHGRSIWLEQGVWVAIYLTWQAVT